MVTKCILLQNGPCYKRLLFTDILNFNKQCNASIILTIHFSLPTKKLFNFKIITLSLSIIVKTLETIYENYFYFGTGINCVHLSTLMEERLLQTDSDVRAPWLSSRKHRGQSDDPQHLIWGREQCTSPCVQTLIICSTWKSHTYTKSLSEHPTTARYQTAWHFIVVSVSVQTWPFIF